MMWTTSTSFYSLCFMGKLPFFGSFHYCQCHKMCLTADCSWATWQQYLLWSLKGCKMFSLNLLTNLPMKLSSGIFLGFNVHQISAPFLSWCAAWMIWHLWILCSEKANVIAMTFIMVKLDQIKMHTSTAWSAHIDTLSLDICSIESRAFGISRQ